MAKKIRVLIIAAVSILFIFIMLAVGVGMFGKRIIIGQLQQNLKTKVTLESISLNLPLSVHLKKLTIGDFFQADKISFSPNLFGLLFGKIVLDDLSVAKPALNIIESWDGGLNLPQLQQKSKQPPVLLTSIKIIDGRVVFLDKKVIKAGYKTVLDEINLNINKVMFPPTSLNTKFKFSVVVKDKDLNALGSLDSHGWVDFGPKNMDAVLNVKNLDIVYFSPYYGNFISKQKLLSAKLNLQSNFKANSNNLTIDSNFKLSHLVYAQAPETEEGLNNLDLVRNTLDFFTDRDGNIILDFSIRTKLDKPGINIKELKEAILEAAVKNLANQPPQDLLEKAINIFEKFKALGKELKGAE